MYPDLRSPAGPCTIWTTPLSCGQSRSGAPLRAIHHRLDRALRATLEVSAVAAYGYWGWAVHTGVIRAAWALGAMIVAATIWDAFQVPGDAGPSPLIAVPGWGRLTLEAAYLTGAATSLVAAGAPELGICFALLVAIHFTLTHRRVVWLFREGQGDTEG